MKLEHAVGTSFNTEDAEAQRAQGRYYGSPGVCSDSVFSACSAPLRPLRRERLAPCFTIAVTTGSVA